jgi:hypothetical protein
MGSWTDSVITFRIYGNDGSTLIWESDSITVPTTYWLYYGLPNPIKIDSADFYIAITHRRVDPYAHPYINEDNGTAVHSIYGSPGNWTVSAGGEYCFFAWVSEVLTGIHKGTWTARAEPQPLPSFARGILHVPALQSSAPNPRPLLLDAQGRRIMTLSPGANDISRLAPGVYFYQDADRRAGRVTILQ